MSDLTPTRNACKYVDWIRQEFKPRVLATDDDTIKQHVENAVRYWNTHSAYRICSQVPYAVGQTRVQLPAAFKTVVQVQPNRSTTWIWNDHPLWTLTSIQVLDSVTTDLIMMSEAFRNYRIYCGTNFNWVWDRAEDINTGGYLYAINIPGGTASLFVVGTKRILPTEDVTEEHILDWLLRYIKGLVKMSEGATLRAASVIKLQNDGQQFLDEGKEEVKDLQEDIHTSARWVVFTQRWQMFQILFQQLTEALETSIEDQKLQWFVDRTNKHIALVTGAAEQIVKVYPEFQDLLQRAEVHDASKFEEPEKTPYISITWRHKLENEQGEFDPIKGKGYQTPGR